MIKFIIDREAQMQLFFYRTANIKMKIIFTLLVIVALSSNIFAQLSSSRGIYTNILNTTPSSTTIEFILNDYDELTVDANGNESMFYSIPGSVWLMKRECRNYQFNAAVLLSRILQQ
jgi:hypothetical protein